MSRDELKEIIRAVVDKLHDEEQKERETPSAACIWGDGGGCDVTTKYAVGEEG